MSLTVPHPLSKRHRSSGGWVCTQESQSAAQNAGAFQKRDTAGKQQIKDYRHEVPSSQIHRSRRRLCDARRWWYRYGEHRSALDGHHIKQGSIPTNRLTPQAQRAINHAFITRKDLVA